MTSPLRLQLLGRPLVWVRGEPLPPLRSRRGISLLARLALAEGAPLERSALAQELWPEASTETALGNLRRTLTDLKRALGAEGERLHAPTPRTLALDLRGCDRDPEDAKGVFLLGHDDEWVLLERERRQARRQAELLAQVPAASRGEAVRLWRQVVALEPLEESHWRGLMEALAADGDLGGALRTYRQLRERLWHEGNLRPDPQTQQLYTALRARLASVSSIPQVPVSGPQKNEVSAAALPRPTTRLIGRQSLLCELTELLAQERLVTLTGLGGMGKTRLALELAERFGPELPEGAIFVPLAGVGQREQLPGALARALGATASSITEVVRLLQGRRLLLVLDNAEHLLEAVAELVEPLSQLPSLHLLVTSRQRLGVPGELTRAVPPLTEEEAQVLFVERANRIEARALDDTALLARLCARLEGIPLAIELAAARLRILPAEQIEHRLSERFRLLKSERGFPERHRSLQAVIEASWQLLSPDEQRDLARLSVFAGSWSLAAAHAVAFWECDDSFEVLERLETLVDHSLVTVELGGRYRLLETIREFGAGQLGADDAKTTHQRFVSYYHRWRIEIEARLDGMVMEAMETEQANLWEALRIAESDPALADIGLALAIEYADYCVLALRPAEGASFLQTLLRHASPSHSQIAEAHFQLGRLLQIRRIPACEEHYVKALEQARTDKSLGIQARILGNYGLFALQQRRFDLARERLQQGKELALQSGHSWLVLAAKLRLGLVEFREGNHDLARTLLWELVKEGSEHDCWASGHAVAYQVLAELALSQGEREQALAHLVRALELADSYCYRQVQFETLTLLISLETEQHTHYQQRLEAWYRLGSWREENAY